MPLHPPFASTLAPRPELPLRQTRMAHRQALDRRQTQLLLLAVGSYGIDTLLMLGFALQGLASMSAPALYFAASMAVTIGFHRLLASGWTRRFADPFVMPAQMAAHAAVVLPFIVWAPQISLPLLMLLFILVGFCGLQINLQRGATRSIASIVLMSACGGGMVFWLGDSLAFPSANWEQRLLSGTWFAMLLLRATLLGLHGARLRGLLSQRNRELAATFGKLEQLAYRDELTGALSRRSIMNLLDDERQRMKRTGQPFGVALLDIDHFKRVNDRFGHLTGDEVLRRFTTSASGSMRATDRLGRYGGEEFMLVFTATADESSGLVALERIRSGVESVDWDALAPGLRVTVSAGLAIARPGESGEQLLSRADAALYEAKHLGRNRVRVG